MEQTVIDKDTKLFRQVNILYDFLWFMRKSQGIFLVFGASGEDALSLVWLDAYVYLQQTFAYMPFFRNFACDTTNCFFNKHIIIMRCTECGCPNPDGATKCMHCGSDLTALKVIRQDLLQKIECAVKSMSNDYHIRSRYLNRSPSKYYVHYLRSIMIVLMDCDAWVSVGDDVVAADISQMHTLEQHPDILNADSAVEHLIRYDRSTIREEICPVCGKVLSLTEAQRCFGDDWIYNCKRCHNTFIHGGTYFDGSHLLSLETFSSAPEELADNVLRSTAQKIAEILNGLEIQYDNERVLINCSVVYLAERCLLVSSVRGKHWVIGAVALR